MITQTLGIYFLNVDQADSILLKGPDFTILINAGRHDRNDVLSYLQKLGITEIDLLIGTHPHSDYIGQFPAVLDNIFIKEVLMNGDVANTTIYDKQSKQFYVLSKLKVQNTANQGQVTQLR